MGDIAIRKPRRCEDTITFEAGVMSAVDSNPIAAAVKGWTMGLGNLMPNRT